MTTNVKTLGQEYIVTDLNGEIHTTIRYITHDEILSAAIGMYDESVHTIAEYLTQSVSKLTDCDLIDNTKIYWFAADMEDSTPLTDLVAYAAEHGYNTVIAEYFND